MEINSPKNSKTEGIRVRIDAKSEGKARRLTTFKELNKRLYKSLLLIGGCRMKDMFMEMGALGLVVIIVLPSYFMLDKYFALHRTYNYKQGRSVLIP
jgi:hypothetical protein